MSGCMVEGFAPYLVYAGTIAMNAIGERCSELPRNTCCTYPLPFRTMTFSQRDAIKKEMGDSASGRQIITLCPGCDAELQRSGIDATHIVNLLAENRDRLPKFRKKIRVSIEPGCHFEDLIDDMRTVTEALGAEYIHNDFGCCGKMVQGVTEPLMVEREKESEGADIILVACPMCFTRYDSYPGGIPVMHIAELVAAAAGDTETLKYHKIHPDVF
jgi:heterodisulfide reductase subunit B